MTYLRKHKLVKQKNRELMYENSRHVDHFWIIYKTNGNAVRYYKKDKDSLAVISMIHCKRIYVIWYYNLILLMKYIKRKLIKAYEYI